MNYNKKVMNEFMHPKNMGEIKNPDGIGKVGNPQCGDIMWVYIKVKRQKAKPLASSSKSQTRDKSENEIIGDIKFRTFGCAAAIATSSIITKIAKGKKLSEVEKLSYKDVVKSLGGLPNIKIHCSAMAAQALNKAIKDYKDKHGK